MIKISDSALVRFIQKESSDEIKRLIYLSLLSGLFGAILLALINVAAQQAAKDEYSVWEFFAYAATLPAMWLIIKRNARDSVRNTQELIHQFKMKIMAQVIQSDYRKIDEVGRQWILQTLIRDTQTVSQSILTLVNAGQCLGMLIAMCLYLAIESIPAFLVVSCASGLIFLNMIASAGKTNKEFSKAWHEEGKSFDLFTEFMNGFKEVKMNSARAADISQEILYSSRRSREMKIESMTEMVNASNITIIYFYIVVGIAVFILPHFFKEFSSHVQSVTTTIMFLVGSLGGIANSLPVLTQASASAEELFALEEKLKITDLNKDNSRESFGVVDSIELRNIEYSYEEHSRGLTFRVGPVNYIFQAGKIYFVRGGNGSGKSTIVKILIGLFKPSFGSIMVNNHSIPLPASDAYRNLFSVIFSDFYLFQKLYGIYKLDDQEIDEAINFLGMGDKVSIQNNRFTDINFSTGQRKRLALIATILENKQFIVLDEWAADQDPEFRKNFYEVIIPELKRIGKTVIAVTHDDAYYHLADDVLIIDNGQIK